MKLKEIILKASSIWLLLGTLLVMLGSQGVNVPSWAAGLFSQAFLDALLIAVGGVVDFISLVRLIFAGQDSGEASVSSTTSKWSYYTSPYKI